MSIIPGWIAVLSKRERPRQRDEIESDILEMGYSLAAASSHESRGRCRLYIDSVHSMRSMSHLSLF